MWPLTWDWWLLIVPVCWHYTTIITHSKFITSRVLIMISIHTTNKGRLRSSHSLCRDSYLTMCFTRLWIQRCFMTWAAAVQRFPSVLGRLRGNTHTHTRHDAYARASHAFPSWAYGNILDGEAGRRQKPVADFPCRSFTLAHMWKTPERRAVKCERTLVSPILQIAESIIRALTHTDGGSGMNGNRRNSGAGQYPHVLNIQYNNIVILYINNICNDFYTNITLSNIVNIYWYLFTFYFDH